MKSEEGGYVLYEGIPKPVTKTRARDAFDFYTSEMMREWFDRQLADNRPSRRSESPNAWFKREAYRLLVDYISLDLMSIFRERATFQRRSHRLVDEATKNPFKLGLLAFSSDDETLSRNNRHVFGNQMAYAWAHDVPPDFLNAFLAVSGGPAQIAVKLKSGQPEPGFEHRFKPSRIKMISDP